jgi:Xaa-Pro aminopeptidase
MWAGIQAFMREQRIDGWLVFDFRGSNQVLARLIPAPGGKRKTTRRAALFVPANGTPTLLAQELDAEQFVAAESLGVKIDRYVSWAHLRAWLERHSAGGRIAMEYSPGNALPVVSMVDGGAIELVRSFGAEVVSSADLIQVAVSRWSAQAVKLHAEASCLVAGAKDAGFGLIRERLAAGKKVFEHEAAQHIRDFFTKSGLEWPDGPIVAANAHAADPHYEPSAEKPTEIRKGDWILIDLWARKPGDENIHSDITWTGYAGSKVPARQMEVFQAVRAARDASLKLAQGSFKAARTVQGWQLDEAAMKSIIAAGFEKGIKHRTGHSLSPGPMVHGTGMNLDNLETHDTRQMLAGTGFTIEPGIYLPSENFGVRNEINVYVDPEKGPVVTSCKQDEPVLVA